MSRCDRTSTKAAQDLKQERFDKAKLLFEAADQLSRRSEEGIWGRLFRWRRGEDVGGEARFAIHGRDVYNTLEELGQQAREKVQLAERYATTRGHADDLHAAADGLRMRLIGLGEDLSGAVRELQERLAPFYVLNSRGDWTKLDHIWTLLDEPRQVRLRREVDELLFLWMAGVESAFRSVDRDALVASRLAPRRALDVCDKALVFTKSQGPWRALRGRLHELMDDGETEGRREREPDPGAERARRWPASSGGC